MQPTQQNVVPVMLFNGPLTLSENVVTLDPTYDHLISNITVANDQIGELETVTLYDQDGVFLWQAVTGYSAGTIGLVVEGGAGIVLQSQSQVTIEALVGTPTCSVSAYRLNPSAAFLFS